MKIRKYTPTGKHSKDFCNGAAEVVSGSPMTELMGATSNRIERVTMRTTDGYIVDIMRDELEAAMAFCKRVDPTYERAK